MGVRHAEQEQLERLEAKTLDAQLRQILVAGLGVASVSMADSVSPIGGGQLQLDPLAACRRAEAVRAVSASSGSGSAVSRSI